MTTTNISQLKFNKLSEAQYEGTTPVDGEFYITPCPTYALDSEAVHKSGDEEINGVKTFNGSTPIILNNTTGKNCRLQLRDSTTTYGDSGIEIFQATSNNFNQFLIHFMNGNQYPFHIDQDASDSSKFTTYINKKLVKGFVTETYKSGTNWYRVWSDGWIEQGGYTPRTSDAFISVSFARAFSQDNPNVQLTRRFYYDNDSAACQNRTTGVSSVTTTGFKCYDNGWSSSGGSAGVWYACGY